MKSTALFASLLWVSLASAAAVAVPMSAPVVPAIAAFPVPEITAAADSDTENQLSGPCRNVTFIFARGTNEDGNVGARVGPPLIADLRAALGTDGIAAQGVDYDASVLGYLEGGSPSGITTMTGLINTAAKQCPDTKIVISGYSQGAQLVHKAAAKLTAAVTARVVAVAIFGDPERVGTTASTLPPVGKVPAALVDSFCHVGDIICTGEGGATEHLDYDENAPAASAFILGLL
ncbi:cutinase-domain-containing protein [Mycena rosella]|uniref:Cutinase n=1 Tax=Mycena rosella TaxID=1033263 RepID=A0AAD7DEP7_MYCRO|nr:cutinase-domain-containing protein [Mycena rosella]